MTILIDTIDTKAGGNTSPQPRSRKWCFTLNNYEEDDIAQLTRRFETCEARYIIGIEVAPTTGTPHLQGYVAFKNAISFTKLKAAMPRAKLLAAHGTDDQNFRYCSKNGEGVWVTNMPPPRPPPVIEDWLLGKDYYAWQEEVLSIICEVPDHRTIHWVWEGMGNAGKSALARHIVLRYPDTTLVVSGKAGDILYGVAEFCKKHTLKTLIVDCPRVNLGHVSIAALESIKNGLFYSTKYESSMVVINSPHIIVFANSEPDYAVMSKDRWHIINASIRDPPTGGPGPVAE